MNREPMAHTRSTVAPKPPSRICSPASMDFLNVGSCRSGKQEFVWQKYRSTSTSIRSRGGKMPSSKRGKSSSTNALSHCDDLVREQTTYWRQTVVGRTGYGPSPLGAGGYPGYSFFNAIADCMNTRPLDFPWYRKGCEFMESLYIPSLRLFSDSSSSSCC